MRPREIALLLVSAVVLAVAGVLVLSGEAEPVAAFGPPGAASREPAPALEDPADDAADALEPSTAFDEPVESTPRPMAALDDGAVPTAGEIHGVVRMSGAVAGAVRSYTVVVEEAVNDELPDFGSKTKPWTLQRSFRRKSKALPRFVLEGIPFSKYGYRIEVFATGYNGTSQFLAVSETKPIANAELAVSAGVPFTLRLRDQHRHPAVAIDAAMRPIGKPLGRDVYRGTSDAYGSIVHAAVLRGEYEVWIGDTRLATVEVAPAAGIVTNGQPSNAQFAEVVVPTGRDLRVEVFGSTGYGIQDAKVEVYAIDTTENIRHELTTDHAGVATFQYLRPGRYQLDVSADGHQRTTRPRIEVPESDPIETVKIKMAQLR